MGGTATFPLKDEALGSPGGSQDVAQGSGWRKQSTKKLLFVSTMRLRALERSPGCVRGTTGRGSPVAQRWPPCKEARPQLLLTPPSPRPFGSEEENEQRETSTTGDRLLPQTLLCLRPQPLRDAFQDCASHLESPASGLPSTHFRWLVCHLLPQTGPQVGLHSWRARFRR